MGKSGSFGKCFVIVLCFLASFSFASSEVDDIMADYEFFSNYHVIRNLDFVNNYGIYADTAPSPGVVDLSGTAGAHK